MKRLTWLAAAVALMTTPAAAGLPTGAKAPVFTTQAAKAGKAFGFNLRSALAKGPVVLYFYPKAFTHGCTLEANAFAEASPEFAKFGATVIGMSNDDINTLKLFSVEACRNKFAVGSATPTIVKAYDVDLKREGKSTGVTSRTSYVIDQKGNVVFVHEDLDYKDHVRLTLDAVKKLKAKKKS
ncbi:Putative peroxiredoxin bcp [Tsuneonella dongtanensis]|uniref:thioredoxin-dependent peroxiredoxin n=1 Tax=Tsuneonella dongtanensis TaxID=692370 RepID=A0A1B2AF26_9SPHN|nr:peroxiredoxin [Tsuneonella dongtanensis]ANY20759.1 Putative peroxiredoxin bcp [Tsuneonella dongtanensis]